MLYNLYSWQGINKFIFGLEGLLLSLEQPVFGPHNKGSIVVIIYFLPVSFSVLFSGTYML